MVGKVIVAGLAWMLLVGGSVGTAQAYDWRNHRGSTFEVTVENSDTTVSNNAVAEANTGDNDQDIDAVRSMFTHRTRSGPTLTQLIETGNSAADALADAVVNETFMQVDYACVTSRCGSNNFEVGVENDDTRLSNNATADAETGDNDQDIDSWRRNSTQTTRTGGSTAIGTATARVNMTDLRISR